MGIPIPVYRDDDDAAVTLRGQVAQEPCRFGRYTRRLERNPFRHAWPFSRTCAAVWVWSFTGRSGVQCAVLQAGAPSSGLTLGPSSIAFVLALLHSSFCQAVFRPLGGILQRKALKSVRYFGRRIDDLLPEFLGLEHVTPNELGAVDGLYLALRGWPTPGRATEPLNLRSANGTSGAAGGAADGGGSSAADAAAPGAWSSGAHPTCAVRRCLYVLTGHMAGVKARTRHAVWCIAWTMVRCSLSRQALAGEPGRVTGRDGRFKNAAL